MDALLRVREERARSGFRPEPPFADLCTTRSKNDSRHRTPTREFRPGIPELLYGPTKTRREESWRRRSSIPVHLNQNVQRPVGEILSGVPGTFTGPRPADYKTFVYLMDRCHFIISDSGGIQEEAPSMGKPLLITRENTERPEAVESGAAKLIGTDSERLVLEAEQLLSDPVAYRAMVVDREPLRRR